ncbi:type-F conjugative transfer system mating-pair stabilization protein TraN [Entomohabitans teleogrylli]|uniref:type-F conjugative transfer system mating-pair stabilization protein TraN n=1 Tax=Entomohabitans teleogrylli TaxID=1384589 RepID=UPI00073D4555|nr:type-F conjugative transfer system mating-pair stabilization protein TraN [Entomohabitans teleogrylli]
MKKPFLVVLLGLSFCSQAGSEYNEASKYASGLKGQGMDTLKGASPEDMIPGYTASPEETQYWGGTTATGSAALENAGAGAMNTTEVGKVVTDVVRNRPTDEISLDAPFISNGLAVVENAQSITQGTDTQCTPVSVDKTKVTTYSCERTPGAELSCIRTASIGGQETDIWITEAYRVTAFRYSARNGGFYYEFPAPASGVILSAVLHVDASGQYLMNSLTTFMNTTFNLLNSASYTLAPAGMSVTEGDYYGALALPMNGQANDSISSLIIAAFSAGRNSMALDMTMQVKDKGFEPVIDWVESCPFDKSEEVLTNSICLEEGGTRTVTVGGTEYPVYSDCWKYKDVYVAQDTDTGTCGAYMNNSACTLSRTTCLESLSGTCLREQAVFSCETASSGNATLCGTELVCTDGSCDQIQNDVSDDFHRAVSGLAALSAAGEDIAALNGVNVAAFTGSTQTCRQAAVGFSNCCKDSGWGNDTGLASCNSDEKALGHAKERKLTIYVGTYCSRKVLGACLQKKQAYCQFDSKLAKIVQEQGRGWQLGIGFGSASSPDCRGITVEELQSINFDALNFADFYDDLENGTTIPADQELIDRVKAQIAGSLQGGSQ